MQSMVPKILGADVELSNFILGISSPEGSGHVASRMLLGAIGGIESGVHTTPDGLDWGRKFLASNGGCAYIDSNHLEIALSETFSAFDHVAYWRAMLLLVRQAMQRVNDNLPSGSRLQVLANCSDGLGNSYGSHVNLLLTRDAWDDIIYRKPHYLAYLAAFQISSVVFTGQGKVGTERGRPHVDFQLSQRADFIETLAGFDTMVQRAVVNTRDEPHCGSPRCPSRPALARLHVIFFDSTLCQVATLLRAGTLQMIVAMLEAGCVDHRLALDDPLLALACWSRDPSLASSARRVDGTARTAVEMQLGFLEDAKRFAARGGFSGIVPESDRLIALWEDTLLRLQSRDFATLSRRLDWVLKRRLLQGAIARRPTLTWESPGLKQLDQLFASLDESDGLFWAVERAGQVDRVVEEHAVLQAGREPPPDTRAWTRAHLLRRAGADRVEQVDWDRVRISTASRRSWISTSRVVHMPLPFGATRAINEKHFAEEAALEVVLEALRAASDDSLPALVTNFAPQYWTIRTGEDDDDSRTPIGEG